MLHTHTYIIYIYIYITDDQKKVHVYQLFFQSVKNNTKQVDANVIFSKYNNLAINKLVYSIKR